MSKSKKGLGQVSTTVITKLPKTCVKPASTTIPKTDEPDEEEDLQERFERELCWCVEQLNITLSETDPSKKKYSEYLRALQTLQNPKTCMVKKRQVMSTTLGNYRDKMRQQKSKFMAECARKTNLQTSASAVPQSIFLKTTALKHGKDEAPSPSQFQFGFAIDEEAS
ncbi:conserved hypothetical protein [Ixodes scapularis]|uniref:Uncharacterized protein n=1 Tax=Ixodes scapularis TaxID=6945 RepID=B7PSU3_IXOSC|nr:conserved hypothetical protein [Ixodes scapularis]|eukprot:XP_002403107.1 conserved hypothetical protein [Ixodes scapularis]